MSCNYNYNIRFNKLADDGKTADAEYDEKHCVGVLLKIKNIDGLGQIGYFFAAELPNKLATLKIQPKDLMEDEDNGVFVLFNKEGYYQNQKMFENKWNYSSVDFTYIDASSFVHNFRFDRKKNVFKFKIVNYEVKMESDGSGERFSHHPILGKITINKHEVDGKTKLFESLQVESKPLEKNGDYRNIDFMLCCIPKDQTINGVMNRSTSSKTVENGQKDGIVSQNSCEAIPLSIQGITDGFESEKIVGNKVQVAVDKKEDTNDNEACNTKQVEKLKKMGKFVGNFQIDVNDTDKVYGIVLEYGISSTDSPFFLIFCHALPKKITIVPIRQKDMIENWSLVSFSKLEYDTNVMMKLERGDVSNVGLTHIVNHGMYSVVEDKGKKFRVLLENYEVIEHRESEECHEFDHPIFGTVKDFKQKNIKNVVYRNMKLNLSKQDGLLVFEVIDSEECQPRHLKDQATNDVMYQSASLNVSATTPANNIIDAMKIDVQGLEKKMEEKKCTNGNKDLTVQEVRVMENNYQYLDIDDIGTGNIYGIICGYNTSSTYGLCANIFNISSPSKFTMVPVFKRDKIKAGSLVRFTEAEYNANVVRYENWEWAPVGLTHISNHLMYEANIEGQKIQILLKYYKVVNLRKTMECHEFDHPIFGTVEDFQKKIQNVAYRTMELNLTSNCDSGFKVVHAVKYVERLVEETILREDMPEDPEERKKQWKEIHHWMGVQREQEKWDLIGPLKVVKFCRFFKWDGVYLVAVNPSKDKKPLHFLKQIQGYLDTVEPDEDDNRMCGCEFPNGFMTPHQNGFLFIPDNEARDIPLEIGELCKFIARGRTQPAIEYK